MSAQEQAALALNAALERATKAGLPRESVLGMVSDAYEAETEDLFHVRIEYHPGAQGEVFEHVTYSTVTEFLRFLEAHCRNAQDAIRNITITYPEP